jgi:hypothetical protein
MQDSSSSGPPAAASSSQGNGGGGGGGGGGIPAFERDPVTYLTLLVSAPRASRESLHKLAGSVATTVAAKGRSSAFSPNGAGAAGRSGGSGTSPYGLAPDVAYLYLQAAARHLPAATEASEPSHVGPISSSSSSSSGMALFNPFNMFSTTTDPETDVPGDDCDDDDDAKPPPRGGAGEDREGETKQPPWGLASSVGSSDVTSAVLEVRICRSEEVFTTTTTTISDPLYKCCQPSQPGLIPCSFPSFLLQCQRAR